MIFVRDRWCNRDYCCKGVWYSKWSVLITEVIVEDKEVRAWMCMRKRGLFLFHPTKGSDPWTACLSFVLWMDLLLLAHVCVPVASSFSYYPLHSLYTTYHFETRPMEHVCFVCCLRRVQISRSDPEPWIQVQHSAFPSELRAHSRRHFWGE